MIGTKTILVIAVINSDLDRDRCIDQTDHSRGNADVVGVTSIRSASKSDEQWLAFC